MPVVGLADSFVQRLELHVIQPPPPDRTGGDRRHETALDQPRDEVVTLLPVHYAGELAVLPLEEHAGEHEHMRQEAGLALGHAERLDSGDAGPAHAGVVGERDAARAHASSSSARRRCREPPRPPPTPPIRKQRKPLAARLAACAPR